MQKGTVSPGCLSREVNRRMPNKRGFLASKRNSFSLSIYHFDWTDLFLSAASRKARTHKIPGLSGRLCLPLVTVFAEHTTNLKLVTHIYQPKIWHKVNF